MSAGIVTVGRRSYAVGLYWENSPSGRIAQTAKEAARQPGQKAEYYALRPGNKEGRVPQFGLSQAAPEHKAGMPVFAACLANQQPGSWAGAFRLREGIVITVVRDELILPDGDLLFLNETEARDRLLQEMSFGGLQKIYAPEAWAIPGSDTMPVTLLMDERRDITLRPVDIPKKIKVLAAIGVIFLISAIGAGWYFQQMEARQEADRISAEEAAKRARDAANKYLPSGLVNRQPVYPPPVRHWEENPDPLKVIEACQGGLAKVPFAISGWHLTTLKCDGISIRTQWSRSGGFSALPPGASIDPQATTANINISLPKLIPRGHEDLLDPKDITNRYLAQNWPGTLNRIADDPPPPPPQGYQGQWTPPPTPWVKRSFTVTVQELPSSLPVFWNGIPGLVVNSLSLSISNAGGTWLIEGVIYENRV